MSTLVVIFFNILTTKAYLPDPAGLLGMCGGKDYYKILQVDEKATPADIKKVGN